MAGKTTGVVAAGHAQTAEAGKRMLEEGGNAFDAAIASVLAACVVESSLTSLGGGGFLLAQTAEKKSYLFDFFCQTPQVNPGEKAVDFYPVALNFGGAWQTFHIGKGAIAVPGMVAGLFAVQRKLGRLPFKVLIEPAVEYARRGFTLNRFNDFTYRLLEPILNQEQEGRQFYAPEGKILRQGEKAYLPQFAEVLEQLACHGSEWFYRGELAQLALGCLGEESALTAEDWADYQVQICPPLRAQYRQWQLLTNPPPSAGGILIAFALKLLEKYDLRQYPLGSAEQIQLLSRVMALSNQARQKYLDGNLHLQDIEAEFLRGDRLGFYQNRLNSQFNHSNKLGSTTHISILDGEGNAASLTSSNGEGSGHFIPGTGIMLNNMLGEADLNPQGFYQWETGHRLSSMMAPSILLNQEQPRLVLGSGGSNRIRSAILQVICHHLDYQLPLSEAVAQGRIHWECQQLDLEPSPMMDVLSQLQFDDGTQTTLWTEQNMFFGGVHGVATNAAGHLEGVGDPRRSGAVAYSLD
ncbi:MULTISPECIES: gamma-glutamyltransferase [unclassified Synechocystis]|uniref:gamma-glutamyltransferase n=1 Tax=unclassified Synechocystis TaxID=2640012 RepID=UPI000402F9FE|nr:MULTISPECIES: gamma-glutamyltransferase [unclassified Synechocystis]AIE75878.1 Gamma-glutamyltranspeptidase [Synechocystis sp. PCC 6714]MCT0255195.1 gamma-glutamyltransferase [Synechocystis sp. CS-94]